MIIFTTTPKYTPRPEIVSKLKHEDKYLAIHWFKYFQYRSASISTLEETEYFKIVSLSYPLLAINIAFITALRENGRKGLAILISVISLSTNFFYESIFNWTKFYCKFQWNWCTREGAAIATSASRIFQLIFIIFLF